MNAKPFRAAALLTCAALALATATGCGGVGAVTLSPAYIFSDTTVPLNVGKGSKGGRKGGHIGRGVRVPPNLKTGNTTHFKIVPWYDSLSFAWGDLSTEEAMRDGGLGEVVFADGRTVSILGLFIMTEITAYGPGPGEATGEWSGDGAKPKSGEF